MRKPDPNILFSEVEPMLRSLAGKATEMYGIPFDQALSECHFAFVKAYNWRYKPGRSKFSTCVYSIAKWRIKNLVIARIKEKPLLELNEELSVAAPPDRSPSLEVVDDLSKDAKELLHLLLDTPSELLGNSPNSVKTLVAKAKRHLIAQGKAKSVVNEAHRELTIRFRAAWA